VKGRTDCAGGGKDECDELPQGALNLQDLKMTDQNHRAGKCRNWKMTDQIAGLENARPGK